MPADLPDVWRDEDGPSKQELDRWASGELSTLTVDRDSRRLLRLALKRFWGSATVVERATIDRLLEQLHRC